MCAIKTNTNNCSYTLGGTLTAKSLLETIAPTYKQAKLPPGFPSLNSINTDKFDYKTSGDDIKVSAQLEKPVVMFPDYVIISGVQMNFTFNKKNSDKTAWKADVKGQLRILRLITKDK